MRPPSPVSIGAGQVMLLVNFQVTIKACCSSNWSFVYSDGIRSCLRPISNDLNILSTIDELQLQF